MNLPNFSVSRRVATIFFAIFLVGACSTSHAQQQDEAKKPPLKILDEPVTNRNGDSQAWPDIVMADGLDAQQQREVIQSLGRRFEDFTKKGVNTQIDIPRPKKESVDGGVFRVYSYFFTVHSTLDQLGDQNLLTKIFAANANKNAKGTDLGEAEGAKFSYAEEPELLDRIALSMVLRSNDAKSEESVYGGSIVVEQDPQQTHTSTWAPSDAKDDKKPYVGMGIYTKATPLVELPGVLFIEAHMVFYEPEEWFRGRNLLGAKLPLMIQDQVRSLRRELN